jgi:hypothetical protein
MVIWEGGGDMRTEIDSTSKEYVGAPVTEATGIDVTADSVQLAFTATRSSAGAVWTAGEWKTINGRAWAVVLVGPGSPRGPLEAGRYWVKVKVTDNPEIPVLTAPNQITVY